MLEWNYFYVVKHMFKIVFDDINHHNFQKTANNHVVLLILSVMKHCIMPMLIIISQWAIIDTVFDSELIQCILLYTFPIIQYFV